MPETPLEKYMAAVAERIEIPSLMREDAPNLLRLVREAVDLVRWARSGRIGHAATKAIDDWLAQDPEAES